MEPSCLAYALTDDERNAFDRDGYLIFDNMLSPAHVDALIEVSDRVDAKEREKNGVGPFTRQTVRDMIWRDPLFLELVDLPQALPKIWGTLGWNIQIYHTVLAYSPPAPQTDQADHRIVMQGWHQDSGRVNQEIESSPRPRISVKIAYFLSDCSQEGRANLWVVPGSQLEDTYPIPVDGSLPHNTIPIMVPKGGAVLFDRRVWHTASSNPSDIGRKAIFYGYSYRWLRPRDDQTVEHLFANASPIRRQLLGYAPSGGYGYTSPTDEDVPLRVFMRKYLSADAAR